MRELTLLEEVLIILGGLIIIGLLFGGMFRSHYRYPDNTPQEVMDYDAFPDNPYGA